MYCAKCGAGNPDDGRYCRKCGSRIGIVGKSDAKPPFTLENWVHDKIAPLFDGSAKINISRSSPTIRKFVTGIILLVVAFVLAIPLKGNEWWILTLIPGFVMLALALADVILIGVFNESTDVEPEEELLMNSDDRSALPPIQTAYAADEARSDYRTKDLAPPSVVEDTTRHLEMDTENETMTLPEKADDER